MSNRRKRRPIYVKELPKHIIQQALDEAFGPHCCKCQPYECATFDTFHIVFGDEQLKHSFRMCNLHLLIN